MDKVIHLLTIGLLKIGWSDADSYFYSMYSESFRSDGSYSGGGLNSSSSAYIRPCFLLRDDIVIASGDGTKDNPYVLGKKVFEDVELEEAEITFGNLSWRNENASVKISTNAKYTIEYQVGSTTGIWTKAILPGGDVRVSNLKHNDVVYARLRKGTNTGSYTTLTIADTVKPKEAIITLTETSTNTMANITAQVKLIDKQSGANITNSKWIFTKTSIPLGINSNSYTNSFTTNPENIAIGATTVGTYYLHVLTQDNGGNAIETISQAIQVNEPLIGKVEIGDYIKYEPDVVDTSELLEEIAMYSGSISNTAEQIYQEDFNWRVLDIIEEDGEEKIRLISDRCSDSDLSLHMYDAYNNGVYIVDKICKTLCNNPKYADNVQNLKIEDVQKYLNYDILGDLKTVTINDSDYTYYPIMLKEEKDHKVNGASGELGRSEQSEPISQEDEVDAYYLTVLGYDGYQVSLESLDSDYQELFCSENMKNAVWLSSRCVDVSSANYCGFRFMGDVW